LNEELIITDNTCPKDDVGNVPKGLARVDTVRYDSNESDNVDLGDSDEDITPDSSQSRVADMNQEINGGDYSNNLQVRLRQIQKGVERH
jgi:hypothetical protein